MKVAKKNFADQSTKFIATAIIVFFALIVFVVIVSKMENNETQVTESRASQYDMVSDSDDPNLMEAETNVYVMEMDELVK